ASGVAFFNVQGAANGNFASYGVARFDGAAVKAAFDDAYGAGMWVLDGVSLELVQANAGFTTDGGVSVAWSDDDATGILENLSPLAYPLDGEFADAVTLTSYTFTEIASGTTESYALPDVGGLWGDLLAGDIITLLFAETDANVAATYAGLTNFSYAGPTLVVSAAPVPVPAALGLLVAPLALLTRRRRTRA
ncbi:MAG: hypothetical protein RLW62_09030, partial [Gammaproteobacteria bacterium]